MWRKVSSRLLLYEVWSDESRWQGMRHGGRPADGRPSRGLKGGELHTGLKEMTTERVVFDERDLRTAALGASGVHA